MFFVNLIPHLTTYYVQLCFKLTQHSRDFQLLTLFIPYFGCGRVYSNKQATDFVVVKFSDIDSIIIPFFKENEIIGVKNKNFADWCKVAEIIKESRHLTPSGLEEIKKIKQGMNMNRTK